MDDLNQWGFVDAIGVLTNRGAYFCSGVDLRAFCLEYGFHGAFGERPDKVVLGALNLALDTRIGSAGLLDFISARVVMGEVVFEGLWIDSKISPYPEFTELILFVKSLVEKQVVALNREMN